MRPSRGRRPPRRVPVAVFLQVYANGTHTIAARVTDNAGNTEGIGFRYFTISNQGAQVPVELLGFTVQ